MTTIIDRRPDTPAPDLAAIKARQQAARSSGDHAVVGVTLQNPPRSPCRGTAGNARKDHTE